jgi:hypothetical protein
MKMADYILPPFVAIGFLILFIPIAIVSAITGRRSWGGNERVGGGVVA